MATRFRVLVIASNVEKEPYPVYPLGASLIASRLEAIEAEVHGLDLAFADRPAEEAARAATDFKPNLIAVSVRAVDNTTFLDPRNYLPGCAEVVRAVKGACPAPVVLGGSGYSLFPEKILTRFGAEFGVCGEGEEPVARLVGSLRVGTEPSPGNGLYVHRNGSASGSPAERSLPLGSWSEPTYSLFPLEPYLRAGGTASIQTKRGCPEKCTYCTYPLLEGRQSRLREPEAVAGEVARVAELGADYVYFVDNTFNLPTSHAEAICRELSELRGGPLWTAFVTPRGFRPSLAEAMRRAGCASAEIGSEAGSAGPLLGMGKSHTPEDIRNADRWLSEVGVTPVHYLLFGGPGETRESVEETLALVDGLTGVSMAMLALRVYPKTVLFERACREGLDADRTDLLEPTFYLAPQLDPEAILSRLREFAATHPRFLISGLPDNVDRSILDRLRRKGRKGPLWDYFGTAR
jgi:radical SAM superfamily enzyme YgiQ (UPF0313 family)